MEFIFHFVKKKILVHLTQLSYSINESHREDAVRDSSAGAKGQKHAAIRLSVPKEMPDES